MDILEDIFVERYISKNSYNYVFPDYSMVTVTVVSMVVWFQFKYNYGLFHISLMFCLFCDDIDIDLYSLYSALSSLECVYLSRKRVTCFILTGQYQVTRGDHNQLLQMATKYINTNAGSWKCSLKGELRRDEVMFY